MGYVLHLNELDLDKTYSYADYLMWRFKERIELVKGKIMAMSPAPTRFHQEISSNLAFDFRTFFAARGCKVYSAPFDVRLSKDDKATVVQPDLCVICDKSKLDDRGCVGAPELVVEILSEGNSKREMNIKYELYEEAGVPEYWIVDPANRAVLIYLLQDGKFIGLKPMVEGQILHSATFPSLEIPVDNIFAE